MTRVIVTSRECRSPVLLSRLSTKKRLQAFHKNRLCLSDGVIDQMFGIQSDDTEHRLDHLELLSRYGNEQFAGDGLSYRDIRGVLRALQPRANDVIYDLGAGYGRFLIYGATIFESTFKGIEIVADRTKIADRARRRLQLNNLEIITSNVVDTDIGDGSKFYLFSPFFTKTLLAVIEKLRACANHRVITIAALYHSASILANEKWLREVKRNHSEEVLTLRLFKSQ